METESFQFSDNKKLTNSVKSVLINLIICEPLDQTNMIQLNHHLNSSLLRKLNLFLVELVKIKAAEEIDKGYNFELEIFTNSFDFPL